MTLREHSSGRRHASLLVRVGAILLLTSVCRHAPASPGSPHEAQTSRRRQEEEKTTPERPDGKDEKGGSSARPVTVSTLRVGGARLDWCWKENLIAFDVLGPDQYYDVHTMRPDGSGDRCVTCDVEGLPTRNVGQPAWHPSCDYLVVQAEKQEHEKIRFKHVLTPGAGVLNDLWLVDLARKRAQPLRVVDNERGQGTLHPHFSEDGKKLSWTEMVEKGGFRKGKELGYWKLMVADFQMKGGEARLSNVQSFTPGGKGFYENHGFSPDGKKLIYTSNTEAKRFGNDIFVLDLDTGRARKLTDGNYNEHALFSPDGKHIVWISSTESDRGTDYWIMDADGSNKRRLTFFNEKGHPHSAGRRVVVADFAWSRDGKSIVGYYRAGGAIESTSDPVKIVKIDLSGALEPPPER